MKRNRHRQLSQRGAWIFGLLLVAVSALVFLMGSGVIEVERNAPRWVIFLGGLVFLGGGLLVVVHGSGRRRGAISNLIYNSAGATILLSMAVIANWVAFGPGQRQGESSLSLPIGWISRPSGDLEIRIFFGIGAVILDLIVLRGIVHLIRHGRKSGN